MHTAQQDHNIFHSVQFAIYPLPILPYVLLSPIIPVQSIKLKKKLLPKKSNSSKVYCNIQGIFDMLFPKDPSLILAEQ